MSQESERTTINSPKLHHFGILTAHTEEMMNWYAKVLDMTTNFWSTTGGIAFLSNDKANHRIGLISWPGLIDDPDKRPHTKLHHVAFEYATIDDLLNTWERLKGLSIEPVLAADHGFTTAFYYHDPDGNNVELFVDNFGDWDKSTEYIRTSPEFHQNPMGTYVDPEQLMAARKAGASFADLHRRAYAGEFPPSRPMDLSMLL